MRRPTSTVITTFLLAASAAACSPATTVAPSASAAPAHFANAAPSAVFHLEPYPGSSLLTVPVTVGDSTLDFIFDTAGGATLVTPDAAGWAGCDPFGRATGFRHDGTPVHLQRCPPMAVTIGGWAAPARESGVFDLMALFPDGAPPLGGILGLNTFEGRAITLEMGDRRVTVESPASLEGRVAGMTEVPYREGRQAAGIALDPFLAIRSPQGPLWFELDSGNAGTVLIAPHAARQLGLDLATDQARAVTLHLEGYGPVDVMAMEKEMIYDGLLNAELMKRLRITLDLGGERAWLQQR